MFQRCFQIATVVLSASMAIAQSEMLTPPERSIVPMMGLFSPRFAHELIADNQRAHLGLKGDVKSVRTFDLTDGGPNPDEDFEPSQAIVEFDEGGRFRSMVYLSPYDDPMEATFKTMQTDHGYTIAYVATNEEMAMTYAYDYTMKDNRVTAYTLTSDYGEVKVSVANRHDDGTPSVVTVNEGDAHGEVHFDAQGRVRWFKQFGQGQKWIWGDGTIEIVDSDETELLNGQIDKHGNLTEWPAPAMLGGAPDATMTLRSRYTYDAQGNWTALVVESKHGDAWEREMEFKREILYFGEHRKD